eukprot:28966_1
MAFSTPPSKLSQQSTLSQESTVSIADPAHIFDPIHGYIEIPDRIKQIIDTPQFQRLRFLKQLGTSYYVFPGASHNRFEHSIGVMHLAHKLIKHIKSRQPELNITEDEIFCVSAAGLLHDLGHGPFSHVFDNEFMPCVMTKQELKHNKFTHESMSIMLMNNLFSNNNITIKDEHLLLIKSLICPSTHEKIYKEYREKNRGFLYQIVANDETGIDVDKWDYFSRDSRNTGISISFKYERLMEHARVINNRICYQDKTSFELYTMFRTRYELFKRVYSHKASKSIEYMICDILKYANDAFDIVGKTKNPKSYLKLTDHILTQIEHASIIEGKYGMNGLKKAQELIYRLQKRNLYSCCGYLLLQAETVAMFNPKDGNNSKIENEDIDMEQKQNLSKEIENKKQKIKYKEIEKNWSLELYKLFEEEVKLNDDKENMMMRDALQPTDLKVQLMSLSFGMEDCHPIEKTYLYNSKDPNSSYTVNCDQISIISQNWREVVVRAYVKKSEWKLECERVFKTFVKEKGLIQDDEYSDNSRRASLVISPKRNKQKTTVSESESDVIITPTNKNSRKRTRTSASIDFMDNTQRNKKARCTS